MHFDGVVYFNNSIFQENRVDVNTFNGGAVMNLYGVFGTPIFFKKCMYIRNFSSKKGGVFAILAGILKDSDSTYINNSACYGGAVFVYIGCHFIIENGVFLKNQANYGGVFRFTDSANILILNSTLENNEAVDGGCMSGAGPQITLNVKL